MRIKRRVIMTVVLGLLCGLVLSGCSNVWEEIGDLLRITSSAEAQDQTDDQRIETFRVDVGSFLLLTDDVPTVTVSDSATVYDIVSDGNISFTESGAEISLDLDDGDKVIERPASGHVTVIRDE